MIFSHFLLNRRAPIRQREEFVFNWLVCHDDDELRQQKRPKTVQSFLATSASAASLTSGIRRRHEFCPSEEGKL